MGYSLKRLRHLLKDPPAEVHYASSDPEDPRVGDFVEPIARMSTRKRVNCVLIGMPQHIGVERNNGRPGAAGAPTEIRKALYRMATSSVVSKIRAGKLAIVDAGDVDTEGKTLEQMHDTMHDAVVDVISAGAIPIVLGGGHDTAWPTMRALMTLSKPLQVVNIDAHADVRPLHDGVRAHSGSPFRQLLSAENTSLVEGGFVEFGLQHTAVAATHVQYVKDKGMRVMMLDEIRERGVTSSWMSALDRTDASLFVSLDMDCFASAFAPGVSAPAADGFTPGEIAACLRHAGRQQRLVAFDVVEMNPLYDVDGRTAKLAATTILNLIAGIADRPLS